ncbi:MAG: FAD-dependent oxidoreductase, partial [Candidatus Thorarchaeota archaeon]|nr:FAD-dependent oxidoreductase [Candidatus Thorarchaeota archaeon]
DVVKIGPCHDQKEGGSFTQCAQKKIVASDGTEINCNAVLIATGSKYRELIVPGSEALTGVNIHYCATCDGAFYKGKNLFVVGGGNSAFEESLYLKNTFADSVTIIVRGDEPSATPVLQEKVQDAEGINVMTNSEVVELKGENSLESMLIKHNDTGEITEYHPDGIFVFIGMQPNTKFVKDLIKLDDHGFVTTDSGLQTSVLGIFSAGDCRSGATNQAISAAGEGASAAISIREFLKKR